MLPLPGYMHVLNPKPSTYTLSAPMAFRYEKHLLAACFNMNQDASHCKLAHHVCMMGSCDRVTD